ncbi:MAG TPA: PaaI family thioesterase [Alphaproteobacteria bacterium]|jgi:uncharacterized protein (TIGR00369 family)|nr:PaaI family thioesterase [Alphaproteobacteria bacterium]
METKHSTIVAWGDPNLIYAAHKGMKSIDLFRAIKDGKLPLEPSMSLVGAELTGVKPGVVKIELTPDKRHYDQSGAVQTSILLALTDTAAGYAIHTRVPLGVRCATLELQVNVIRPVTVETGRITVIGRATRVGARTANGEARIEDSQGDLLMLMSTTFIVLPPVPAGATAA